MDPAARQDALSRVPVFLRTFPGETERDAALVVRRESPDGREISPVRQQTWRHFGRSPPQTARRCRRGARLRRAASDDTRQAPTPPASPVATADVRRDEGEATVSAPSRRAIDRFGTRRGRNFLPWPQKGKTIAVVSGIRECRLLWVEPVSRNVIDAPQAATGTDDAVTIKGGRNARLYPSTLRRHLPGCGFSSSGGNPVSTQQRDHRSRLEDRASRPSLRAGPALGSRRVRKAWQVA
jgi:hypothetical protein